MANKITKLSQTATEVQNILNEVEKVISNELDDTVYVVSSRNNELDSAELKFGTNTDSHTIDLTLGDHNLGSVQDLAAPEGGLTLRYINNNTLSLMNTKGSSNEDEWEQLGLAVSIVSADESKSATSFKFNAVTSRKPLTWLKEAIDENIDDPNWKIQYTIKQVEVIDGIETDVYDNIPAEWTITRGSNQKIFREVLTMKSSTIDAVRSFDWLDKIKNDTAFFQNGIYNIKVIFTGQDNITCSRSWQITLTSLEFNTTFNDELIYSEDIKNISYTVKGDMSKTISAKLINKQTNEIVLLEGDTTQIATVNQQSGSFKIPQLTHGVYGILFDCVGKINGSIINAPTIYKEFIYVETGNTTPLIRWSFLNGNNLQQYTRTNFHYSIYNPQDTNSELTVELFSENNNTTQIRTIIPDNTSNVWIYYPINPSPSNNGQYTPQKFSIKIQNTDIVSEKECIVKPFDYASLIQEEGNKNFDFNPIGRTNFDNLRDVYIYNNVNCLTVSENFDWVNGGWITDTIDGEEIEAFCVKAGSTATLNYQLFGTDIRNSGKNFKFIFKTKNCKKMNAAAINCKHENKVGLLINAQNSEIYCNSVGTALLDMRYVEDEVVELEYNIEKEGYKFKDQPRESLIVSYINGIASQATSWANSSSEINQWIQTNPSNIEIGSEDCDVYIYRIKAYERELLDEQIMQNYIADAFSGPASYQRQKANNILIDGEIDLDLLKEKCPDLRILLVSCKTNWTQGKKDYKVCTIEHYLPNGKLKDNWKTNAVVAIQGTSSVEYLTSAGNFDIDLSFDRLDPDGNFKADQTDISYLVGDTYYTKAQLEERDDIDQEEVATLHNKQYSLSEDSIPVDYLNVKVNIASSENANNACLAEWFHLYNAYQRRAKIANPKLRDTMEFHPCVIFLREESNNVEFDDNLYHFYACGDIGNSKKNNNAFGMGEEAQYIVDELIANGEINETQREEKIAEYQSKECIVEVSNNVHPICRFKSAMFENYQLGYNNDDGLLVTDVWDGDAVEFRYAPDEDDTSILEKEVLKLWKWLYYSDTTAPGANEWCTNELTRREEDSFIIYEFDTPIPFNDNTFAITQITPNFLLSINSEGKQSLLSQCSLEDFFNNYLKLDINDYIIYSNINGYQHIQIKLPKENVPYDNVTYGKKNKTWKPKFFINFTSEHVLDWDNDYKTFTKTITLDNEEYRSNNFKSHFNEFFESKSVFFHYLFTERYTMIDNRAKNTFIHFDGLKWNFCFDYDNDTALGCNNRGYLTMDYGVEDIDNDSGYPLNESGGEPAFNAHDSVLWVNVRKFYTSGESSLQATYLSSKDAWNATSLNKHFNDYQNIKCTQLNMIDMRRKYLRPFTSGHGTDPEAMSSESKYLPMLQGTKTLQRARFQKYQNIYFTSKYTRGLPNDNFSFRSSGYDIEPQITPYIKCYLYLYKDGGNYLTQRTWPDITANIGGFSNEGSDLNFNIAPASVISKLEGLDEHGIKSASIGNGLKLININFANNENLPTGEGAKFEILPQQTLLSNIDIHNTKITSIDVIKNLTNLRELNIRDTDITTIEFANGGLIEKAYLNDKITTLIANNLSKLTELTMQDYNQIEKVVIKNTPYLATHTFLNNLPETIGQESIVQGINWNAKGDKSTSIAMVEVLEKLVSTPILLIGTITLEDGTMTREQFNQWPKKWPKLIFNTEPQAAYKIDFKNYDGTILHTYYVLKTFDGEGNETTTFNIDNVPVDSATKPSTAEETYTFESWGASHVIDIRADMSFTAQYASKARQYSVRWFKDDKTSNDSLLEEKEADYGSDVSISPENFEKLNKIQEITQGGAKVGYRIFKGWNKSTSCVRGDIDPATGEFLLTLNVHPVWEVCDDYIKLRDKNVSEMNAAEIYTLMKFYDNVAIKEFFNTVPDIDNTPDTCLKIPMGFRPNWENVSSKELLTKPVFLNKSEYVINGTPLFDVDKDWTLLIEANFFEDIAVNTETTVLDTTFELEGGSTGGFKVMATKRSNTSASGNLLSIVNNGKTTPVNNLPLQRQLYVLQHKKNTWDIVLWTGYLGKKTNTHSYSITGITISKITESMNNPWATIAEARKWMITPEGTSTDWKLGSNNFTGTFSKITYYDMALGESDIKDLLTWTFNDFTFEAVSFNGARQLDKKQKTIVDFCATQDLPYQVDSKPTILDPVSIFNCTDIWYGLDFFWKRLPCQWRTIIPKTWRRTISVDSNNAVALLSDSPRELWIPSLYELGNKYFNNTTDNSNPKPEEDWRDAELSFSGLFSTNTSRTFTLAASFPRLTGQSQTTYSDGNDPRFTMFDSLKNGDTWKSPTVGNYQYWVYSDGYWEKRGTTNHWEIFRTPTDSPSTTNYFWFNDSNGSLTRSTTSYTTLRYLLPCFSLY